MKAFVEDVIEKYPLYRQEEALYERCLEMRENSAMRDKLAMLKLKISTIESWFVLLDVDERFIFRQTLNSNYLYIPAYSAAIARWMRLTADTREAPWLLRERAIGKITSFVSGHKELITSIFENNLGKTILAIK